MKRLSALDFLWLSPTGLTIGGTPDSGPAWQPGLMVVPFHQSLATADIAAFTIEVTEQSVSTTF